MGFSVVTSEAEHFLIWLLSMCNLSFVNFLVILPPSIPRCLPHRHPGKPCGASGAGACLGTSADVGQKDTVWDLGAGVTGPSQDTVDRPVTVAVGQYQCLRFKTVVKYT